MVSVDFFHLFKCLFKFDHKFPRHFGGYCVRIGFKLNLHATLQILVYKNFHNRIISYYKIQKINELSKH